MVEDISLRLGFEPKNILSIDAIDTMWNMCRFDLSWNVGKKSPWCAVNFFLYF